MTENRNNYDLEERTALFGENIISLCKTLEQDSVTRPIISQIVRSGTSIGAKIKFLSPKKSVKKLNIG